MLFTEVLLNGHNQIIAIAYLENGQFSYYSTEVHGRYSEKRASCAFSYLQNQDQILTFDAKRILPSVNVRIQDIRYYTYLLSSLIREDLNLDTIKTLYNIESESNIIQQVSNILKSRKSQLSGDDVIPNSLREEYLHQRLSILTAIYGNLTITDHVKDYYENIIAPAAKVFGLLNHITCNFSTKSNKSERYEYDECGTITGRAYSKFVSMPLERKQKLISSHPGGIIIECDYRSADFIVACALADYKFDVNVDDPYMFIKRVMKLDKLSRADVKRFVFSQMYSDKVKIHSDALLPFWRIDNFRKSLFKKLISNGVVYTLYGRPLYLQNNLNITEGKLLGRYIQATTNDMVFSTMGAVQKWIEDNASSIRILAYNYDSLIFDVPASHLDDIKGIVDTMNKTMFPRAKVTCNIISVNNT